MSRTTTSGRPLRVVIGGLAAAMLLTGCGFDAQTLQPYTPAHGVNTEAGVVKVRNLLVVSDGAGNNVVSASVLSSADDRLTDVQIVPVLASGEAGTPLTVSTATPIRLPANQLVVLTDLEPLVQATGELTPGLTARVVMSFASGERADTIAPVQSFENSIYSTLSPKPAPPTAPASAAPVSTTPTP